MTDDKRDLIDMDSLPKTGSQGQQDPEDLVNDSQKISGTGQKGGQASHELEETDEFEEEIEEDEEDSDQDLTRVAA